MDFPILPMTCRAAERGILLARGLYPAPGNWHVKRQRHHQEKAMRRTLTIIGICALASACSSWVQVSPAGRGVSVATPAQVANCTRVGTSTASALSRIAFVQRGSEMLQEELINLARNEAGDMGGNRIVVESPISEGNQTFGVYRCQGA